MARFDSGNAAALAIEVEFRNAIDESLRLLRTADYNPADDDSVRKAVQNIARMHPRLQKRFDDLFYSVIGIVRLNAEAAQEAAVEEITQNIIDDLQNQATQAGLSSTGETVVNAQGNTIEGDVGEGLRFSLNTNPPDDSNIAAAQYLLANPDEYELTSLFGRLNANGLKTLENEFLIAVREGVNPLVLASRLRKSLDLTKAAAQTLARTIIMQSHRQAMHTVMNQNQDVVKEWEWTAHLDDKTCAVCWAMDKTRHPLTEKMKSHPNCRCIQKPVTKTAEELGWIDPLDTPSDRRDEARDNIRTSDEKFARLPDARKLVILGKNRFQLYATGEYDLSDFVKPTNYFSYGEGLAVKSLMNLGYHPKQYFETARTWADVYDTVSSRFARGEIGNERFKRATTAIRKATKSGVRVPPKRRRIA